MNLIDDLMSLIAHYKAAFGSEPQAVLLSTATAKSLRADFGALLVEDPTATQERLFGLRLYTHDLVPPEKIYMADEGYIRSLLLELDDPTSIR